MSIVETPKIDHEEIDTQSDDYRERSINGQIIVLIVDAFVMCCCIWKVTCRASLVTYYTVMHVHYNYNRLYDEMTRDKMHFFFFIVKFACA